MWYRRIIVIEEAGSSEIALRAQIEENDQAFKRIGKHLESRKRRNAFEDSESDSYEEDMREFKHVGIMSTIRRNKHNHPLHTTGQAYPAGSLPRLQTLLCEDEETLSFQVTRKGCTVNRREDNNMINGTKLLNAGRVPRLRRDGILNSERVRHVVALGPSQLKGVWIRFERALELANEEGITDEMYPLFLHYIGLLLHHPFNQVKRNRRSPTVAYGLNDGGNCHGSHVLLPHNCPHQPFTDVSMAVQTGRQENPPPLPPPRTINDLRHNQYDWGPQPNTE